MIIAYCPIFDQLPMMFQEARPTIIVAVPRVYEKIRQEVEQRSAPRNQAQDMQWALRVGEGHKKEIADGIKPASAMWRLADRLVYSRIRQGFGGNSRIYFSGGAPLGYDIAEWFICMGIPIFEGYGLTETSPVISVNRKGDIKIGSVGKIYKELQVKLAEDGEIMVKGPTVFKATGTCRRKHAPPLLMAGSRPAILAKSITKASSA